MKAMSYQHTLEDIQQQLDAISKLVDSFAPQPIAEAVPERTQDTKHLHPRVEFNGELSRMAELVLIHLWTQKQLARLYDTDCEDCPRVDELCHSMLQRDVKTSLEDAFHLYWQLPDLVNCYQKATYRTCLLEAFICCYAVTMPTFQTADILNSLHYMGGLGDYLARDLFGESVNDLMAADTDGQPNQKRKRALAQIGNRIKKSFLDSGLQVCQEKMPAIIKNPFSITDKACTMYRMPYNSLQSQLPF